MPSNQRQMVFLAGMAGLRWGRASSMRPAAPVHLSPDARALLARLTTAPAP
ncbi:hypothetical protein GCM10007164_00150 [Luteimonas padinae]|nr:hypothetical protein GCM10007164_00150 [Luteimonas padinae]